MLTGLRRRRLTRWNNITTTDKKAAEQDSLRTVLKLFQFITKTSQGVFFYVQWTSLTHSLLMTVATATKPTASRKRRTRKVAVKTVKVTSPRRPSAAKLISPNRYWSDVKTRWSIHQYEITMLARDLTKLKHYVDQFTKWPLRPHKGSFFVII